MCFYFTVCLYTFIKNIIYKLKTIERHLYLANIYCCFYSVYSLLMPTFSLSCQALYHILYSSKPFITQDWMSQIKLALGNGRWGHALNQKEGKSDYWLNCCEVASVNSKGKQRRGNIKTRTHIWLESHSQGVSVGLKEETEATLGWRNRRDHTHQTTWNHIQIKKCQIC